MGQIRTVERATLRVLAKGECCGAFRTTGWKIGVGGLAGLRAVTTGAGHLQVRFGVCRQDARGDWCVEHYVDANSIQSLPLDFFEGELFVFSETRTYGDWIVNSGAYGYSGTIVDPYAQWCAMDWAEPHLHSLRLATA